MLAVVLLRGVFEACAREGAIFTTQHVILHKTSALLHVYCLGFKAYMLAVVLLRWVFEARAAKVGLRAHLVLPHVPPQLQCVSV